ncbi:hypothetical protein [Bacillus altitudinis]
MKKLLITLIIIIAAVLYAPSAASRYGLTGGLWRIWSSSASLCNDAGTMQSKNGGFGERRKGYDTLYYTLSVPESTTMTI